MDWLKKDVSFIIDFLTVGIPSETSLDKLVGALERIQESSLTTGDLLIACALFKDLCEINWFKYQAEEAVREEARNLHASISVRDNDILQYE